MLASLESLISCFARNTIMGFYYAVAKGRKPGIYQTWDECKAQVHKFPGPVYKKFSSTREAQEFIDSGNCSNKGVMKNPENFVHARALPPNDLVALGKSKKSSTSSAKRIRETDETSENVVVSVAKRIKSAVSGNGSSSSSKRNNNHFDMDPDGFVNVYTDGACSKNGYAGAKAGVGVYFGEDSPLNVSAPVVGRATNNMAEIQAVTRAAEAAIDAGMTKLRVHTDSEFLIKSVTQWMPGWKRRGWKTAAGAPVANKTELQEMESALKPLKVEWNHVRGHQGIHGNEMADKLAREGAEKYRK